MEKGESVQQVRAGFLAMNASSRFSQKTTRETIIAQSIGNPRKVGERAKLCFMHLSTVYDKDIRFSPAPL